LGNSESHGHIIECPNIKLPLYERRTVVYTDDYWGAMIYKELFRPVENDERKKNVFILFILRFNLKTTLPSHLVTGRFTARWSGAAR